MDYEDYLDSDEEFELMHADEMEMMNELNTANSNPSVKSLKFDSQPIPTKSPLTPNRSASTFNGRSSASSFTKENGAIGEKSVSAYENASKVNELREPTTSTGLRAGEGFDLCEPTTSTGLRAGEGFDHCEPTTSSGLRAGEGFDLPKSSKSSELKTKVHSAPQKPSTTSKPPVPKSNNDQHSRRSLPLMDLEDMFGNDSSARISVSNNGLNKRTADDLFGNIEDIDFEEDFEHLHQNKRSKGNDSVVDKELRQIAQILEARKRKTTHSLLHEFSIEKLEKKSSENTLSRRVPKYAFITLRNGQGEKFYAKLHSAEALNSKIVTVSEQCKSVRLLSIPFENILNEANTIVAQKVSNEINAANTTMDTEENVPKTRSSELWVEKYKPTSYMDLLSDEGTNKVLLQWIKLWDKVVFGREVSFVIKKDNSKFDFKYKKKVPLLDDELDEAGCPKYKLVLLCGPPGLGKTTLAHLIAKQAGYNVVEMNASDDRSPEIFRQQLEAATQMKSVLSTHRRPNCLIIDEIDGAPQSSIEVLIQFAKGEIKRKKKLSKVGALRRPIICICNELYVPALRPLRQVAFVIQFPQTSMSKLAQRLVEIAESEHVKTDTAAMFALCDKANNDIRTCVHTIYCLKDRPILLSTIKKMNLGNKDMQEGLFTVWRNIFQRNDTNTIQSILKSVYSNGDYDKLAQGVYENFLNPKLKYFSVKDICRSLKWFCFYDVMKTTIHTSQTYALMGYLPYCFVVWYLIFSTYQKIVLAFPTLVHELYSRQTKLQQTIQEVLKSMEPRIRACSHYEQLLLDTLPYFTNILNPIIRPVSIQLLTNSERQAFYQLVYTMIDYNLNFVQERTQDGSYQFVIDPNISESMEFPEETKIRELSYSIKMIISKEIEQEKLRRLECALLRNASDLVTIEDLPAEDAHTFEESVPESAVIPEDYEDVSSLPITPNRVKSTQKHTSKSSNKENLSQNHLQKLTPKAIKPSVPASYMKDFFGRIVEKSTLEGRHVAKVDEIVKSGIWFHFKEGFSNAVRRSVYIKDLLSN